MKGIFKYDFSFEKLMTQVLVEKAIFSLLCALVFSDLEFLHQTLILGSSSPSC